MILRKTKTGGIYKFEDGRYYDLKTNKEVYNITPDEILETVKITLTLWQVVKQFIGLIKRLFTKN
jgi:hypothetical protein